MSPTRDRLVLIVPSFLWGCGACYGRHVQGGALLCVCVRVCTCVSFFPPVLLFPIVISEGKVIRCLIGGSVNQSAPYGVHMRASVCVCVCHLQAAPRGLHMQREKHRILDRETRCHDEDPNRAICGRLNIK